MQPELAVAASVQQSQGKKKQRHHAITRPQEQLPLCCAENRARSSGPSLCRCSAGVSQRVVRADDPSRGMTAASRVDQSSPQGREATGIARSSRAAAEPAGNSWVNRRAVDGRTGCDDQSSLNSCVALLSSQHNRTIKFDDCAHLRRSSKSLFTQHNSTGQQHSR